MKRVSEQVRNVRGNYWCCSEIIQIENFHVKSERITWLLREEVFDAACTAFRNSFVQGLGVAVGAKGKGV